MFSRERERRDCRVAQRHFLKHGNFLSHNLRGQVHHECSLYYSSNLLNSPSLRCHLQAALEDVSVESLSHTLSQEGGALNSGAPTVGQARAGHCQMPPQAPVWPSAPREWVRCPDHTGRCMVRGRPTGQLWTPMVQPTLGKSVELRPSQKLCRLPAALPATCTWLQLL